MNSVEVEAPASIHILPKEETIMRVNESMKKVLSIALTLCMVLSCIPTQAYAVGTDCTHHTQHTDDCGYVEAVEGSKCTFVCTECKAEEKTCTCESTDPGEHAPFCDLYERTNEPCLCVLDCAVEGLNDWCETCYFEGVEACAASGEEEDALFTVTEGDCGTGVRYAIDDVTGVLTISGSGAIAKMANATKYPWYSKRKSITKIVIESGVTTIPQYAFNTSSANSVIIPDTVTEIGKSAFYGNANLSSISIPSSVTTIGETAFKNCSNLETVYTNCDETEWNTKLGKNAFQGTLAADEGFIYSSPPATTNYTVMITVSGNGTVSGGGMYPEGDEVTVIATPDTNYKFVHWTENGTSVSTTKIYQFTLTGDRSLTAVFEEFTPNSGACGMDAYYTFDEATGVLTISGTGAMKDYLQGEAPWYDLRAQIKSVVIENGITIVSQYGFHNCDALTSVTIPDSVTSFGAGAFSDCDALTSFTIPPQVKSMGQGVFTGCSNLTSVTISAGVEIIPANTFASTPLTSITIPASVKSIQLYAFYDCEQLTTVNYDGLEDPVSINEPYNVEEAQQVFRGSNISGITVTVPAGYQDAYFCGLPVKLAHEHQWEYTANGTTITAACTAENCLNTDGGSVTIAAPADLSYSNSSKDAACTYVDWLPDKPTIVYNAVDRVNVTGQEIVASVTAGEATVSVSYTITPRNISTSTVTCSPSSTNYDGTEKTVTVTVEYSSTTLTAGTDYEVAGTTSATEIGTYTVTVTGKGNYTGTIEKTWAINKGTLSTQITIEGWTYLETPKVPSVSYNPENAAVTYTYYITAGKKPTVTGTANGAETEGGVPTYAGTYYVGAVIAESEHYIETTTPPARCNFIISPREVSNPTFEGLQTSYPYDNGNEIKPTFTLKDDLDNVIPESEYTVAYSNNTAVGTASITVTDNEGGNYTVSGSATFQIVSHVHEWSFTASGDTITAKCGNADTCSDPEQTIKIAAEGKTYDGTPVTATLTGTIDGVDTPAIRYFKNGVELNESVINAGTYTASIKLGEAEAKVNFTIAKADLASDTLEPSEFAKGLVYDGTEKALVTKPGSIENGDIVFSLNPDGEYTRTIPVATEAGEYVVYWFAQGDKNHKDIGVPGEAYCIVTIAAKPVTDATVTLGEYDSVYNGTAKEPGVASVIVDSMTLTAGKDYTVTYSNNVNAGTATVTIQGIGNFTGTVNKTFTISKAAASVTAVPTAKELTYTGEAQTLVNAGSANGGKLVYSLSEDGEFIETIPAGTNAGEYTVWYYVVGDDNHADSAKGSVKVTITKAKATITVDTTTINITYGETVTLPEATTNFGTVTCDKIAADLVNAGTYTVTYTVDGTDNYDGDTKTVTVTIEKLAVAEPTITGTYTYTGSEQTVALTGVESCMTIASGNKATNTGSYEVVLTLDGNHKWADGSDGKVQWSIGKAQAQISVNTDPITVTYGETVTLPTATTNFGTVTCDKAASDLVNAGTYTVTYSVAGTDNYDGDTKTVTVTINPKTITEADVALDGSLTYTGEEQTQPITVTEGITYTVTGDKATDVGTYELTVKGTGNYTGEVKLSWNIKAAAATVETVPEANDLTYTGEAQTLVTAGTANGGKVVYSLSKDDEYTETIPTGTNAGDYTVWYYVQGDANHSDSAKASVKVTIAKAKAEITVDTDPITVTYGDSVELPEATTNFGTVSCDKTANDLVNAGTYTVTYSVAGTDNYDGDTKTVTVTIEKLAVAEPTVTGTYTYTGTEQTVALAGIESYMTIASGNKATNAGSYEVVITLDGNHKWANGSDGKVQWSIAKAKAEITVDTDPITVTYGEAVTLPTATTNFGTVTCDKAASDLVNAGTYTVTYSVAGTDNYDGDSKTVTVTINPKTITEADVALDGSLVYTGEEQTQQITVTDGITYEVTGNKATKAGKYELTVKGTGNYAGTITLDWEVAKATVTITADNKVIYIGEDIPVLTYKVSGLIGDDKLIKDPTLTTNADENQAGSYTITAANADAGDNYTITYVSGALTIMDQDTEVMTRIEITELTDVPDGLEDTEFDTVDKIIEELISRILATITGYSAENMVHYDVTWQFSLDSGETWIRAIEEHFPTEGITVILPYPEGTNARDYDFAVSHMFSVTSQRLGTTAGDVELPKVEETADGIRVTLTGLSPVTVAAKYHDHTGGTATCTDKAICTVCGTAYGELDAKNHAGGTEIKNAKDATCGTEGYTGDTYCKGCGGLVAKGTTIPTTGEHTYGEWKVVKEATKTAKGEKQRTCSVCGHVDSEEIPMLSDIPATGDDSNIMLWGGTMVISLAALVVLLVESKKRRTAK